MKPVTPAITIKISL